MNPTTQWEKMQVSAETAVHLRGTHQLWSRLIEGDHCFTVLLIGKEPGPNDTGYASIKAALQVKGMWS